MDRLTKQRRSWNMSRIRGKNTAPELAVRSLLHRLGYRFRLHSAGLPGRPDIVLPRYRTVILVHGCFWHRHVNCRFAYTPKTRMPFWLSKFASNVRRDRRIKKKLEALGWVVVIVWECELRNPVQLASTLARALKTVASPSRGAISKQNITISSQNAKSRRA